MQHPYGWLSLAPPIVAIVLAIATRQVVLSLVCGIFAGAMIMSGGDPFTAVYHTWETHLWQTFVDTGKLRVFSFTILMGAMIGVITNSGGMRGLIDIVTPFASNRRRGQLATWLMGLLIFFDDYANTMLIGNTLRPICDRLRISREKLAYLVDSTAAPVAGLAPLSTWVAVEIDYIGSGLTAIPNDGLSAFGLFLSSIPYRFYIWSALILVPITAWLGRDLGPMVAAEQRAVASDGKAGFRRLLERDYALLVTDVEMPVMDGLELATRVRALEASGGEIIELSEDIKDSTYHLFQRSLKSNNGSKLDGWESSLRLLAKEDPSFLH